MLSLLAASAGARARAQDRGAEAAPAPSAEPQRELARTLYEKASKEYDGGNYALAIDLLRQAHTTYPSTLFIFNIAQAQRQLGDCSGARQSYLDFLDAETDPELRARATVGLERLQDCRPDPAQAARPATAPPSDSVSRVLDPGPSRQSEARPLRLWLGWTGTGMLAAATAVTGGLTLSALSRLGDLEAEKPADPAEVAREEQRARNLAVASDVLAGATLVAAGLSLYWTIKARRARRRAAATEGLARFSVHLSSAKLGCSIRF
jgi:tetratricopeptide (TPR) repeat protein